MNQEEKKPFAELLRTVMDSYSKDTSASVIQLWWEALRKFDYQAYRRAMSAWVQNPDAGQFAPKIADIIRMVEGTTGDQAMIAWTQVNKAVRMIGHYRSIAFDDAITHRVIDDMGGWIKLATTETDKDLEFRGNEFIKRYRAFALAGDRPEYPSYLIGATEAQNGASGMRGDEGIKLIGDIDKVIQVIRDSSNKPTLRVSRSMSLAQIMDDAKIPAQKKITQST